MIRVSCRPVTSLCGTRGMELRIREVQNAPMGLWERLRAYLKRRVKR